ncbi:MAG: SUMF1/EgtB/PvdO family nonheme iron enzyme [Phycisphaerales bacterium]
MKSMRCLPCPALGVRVLGAAAALFSWFACANLSEAAVEITHSDGFTWCTVGNPGNPDFIGLDAEFTKVRLGGVDHAFRITRTEVTSDVFFEFLSAYTPHIPPSEWHFYETDTGSISYLGGRLVLFPSLGKLPADGSWRTAARFCNWLHNNRSSEAWSFETGAYDTSTFGQVPGHPGEYTDATTHMPGARFWIPTLDEWMKAAHYDPDRYGLGAEGYWLYPHSSDSPPVGGAPGTGADANIDTDAMWNVGSYPAVLSPYGLLDTAGSLSEWTETDSYRGRRWYRGNDFIGRSFGTQLDNIVGYYTGTSPDNHDAFGFRIATTVPSPAAAPGMVLLLSSPLLRRRQQ